MLNTLCKNTLLDLFYAIINSTIIILFGFHYFRSNPESFMPFASILGLILSENNDLMF